LANTRTEAKFEEQQRLLMQARLEALTSRSIHIFVQYAELRFRVDSNGSAAGPRDGTKLSRILRRRLRKHENFSPLRMSWNLISDYLRLKSRGSGTKLRFAELIEADTLDMLVPSMLLQPLVENSIKHGLSGKIEGGTITLEAKRVDGRLHLTVADDGIGISQEKLATLLGQGSESAMSPRG